MSAISLSGVDLRYPDGTLGLAQICLDIEDGEFVALVGPSGSGKTTLLRTIAGFLNPTAGTVSLGADVVAGGRRSAPPEARELGMVFQQHAIWPHRTVGRNVSYPLEMAGISRAQRAARVSEVLTMVGLAGFERRNPATLSGGQRQRVALARALASSPRALLLDEALSALDEPLRDRLRLELRTLTRAANLTVVHVTHDRAEALALADRVVILDGGRIKQIGSPEEVVTQPASAFVAHFLSDANLIEGIVEDGRFRSIGHQLCVGTDRVHGARNGFGTIAVLPTDIELISPVDGAHTDEHGIVMSSLFGRDSSDVVVTSQGMDFRCSVRGPRPSVGDRVGLRIRRALFYPDADTDDEATASVLSAVSARR
ncbi:ABC transporter ATP-binding protein [Rhodococcus erythropolis]|uniref:ABC transporter ATP-binding protein n=1 Tax=Rhodococcus erythropolis TaxID=1833 RepID=UPI0008A5E03C|nr:ABC transporter ATP-binding protein [Rhodococcus erythropolis]MBT1258312.1 ABC transporter ATP-binding protein [Rhodococcus erythropolis]OHF24877.1 ABC transporter ATP-binding protein [Rhodococcus erythropolis]